MKKLVDEKSILMTTRNDRSVVGAFGAWLKDTTRWSTDDPRLSGALDLSGRKCVFVWRSAYACV